jgi:hypothetical protein
MNPTAALPRAHRAKVMRETWTNLSVLRHGQFEGMLVTSKNSGTHWVKYMLAVALAETHGVPPPPYFSEDAVRPYIGWPKDKRGFAALPRLAFCHSIPHRLADYRIVRSLIGLPPYVLLVRHPMSILASHYEKWRGELGVTWLTYLAGDPAGKRYRCDLYWLARFWNRWGDLAAKYPDQIHVMKYESVEADTAAALREIAAHLRLNLSENAIPAALTAGTKSAMKQRIDPAAEANVLQNRDGDLEAQFSGEAGAIYRQHVKTLFRRDLGYRLTDHP